MSSEQQWHPVKRHRMVLASLEVRRSNSMYEDVLRVLGIGIRHTVERIESAGGESGDWIVDDGCDLIESLLGPCFVVCQTYMTSVVAKALALRRVCEEDNKALLWGAKEPQAYEVRRFGANPIEKPHPFCDVLHEAANYYKHEDEWPDTWAEMTRSQQRTARVLMDCGGSVFRFGAGGDTESVRVYSTGNLRSFAEAVGNSNYDPERFCAILVGWHERLYDEAVAEVRKHGLAV